ncbi:DUF3868 domain-containing protein [Bacteroides sp. AN502(2024)]|uniref:DUF3868 domain-containing protein n=1 Tax=Bacteroides sp. AN502(2024) TaxID=3160599 RepID=UPI003512F12B
MKRFILITVLTTGLASASQAQGTVDGVSVDGVKLEHSGQYMSVDMTLGLSGLRVDGNRAVLLTPRLVNGTDSLELPSVGIYGRRRYYFYVRNGESMLTGKDEMSYKASDKPENIIYNKVLPYQEWMNGAELTLHRSDYGCCNTLLAEQTGTLGDFTEAVAFFPELVYVRPAAEIVKSRSLEGSAFIDFPVNQTVINPEYRRNTIELGKIQATIDSVRNDRDVTITQVWLKGFASPESPYEHNRELAIGRTEALKRYIRQLYSFNDNVIVTDYEPEDWAGLRRYVEQSNIDHRKEILALIDCDREPDAKEWKIKSTYPEEYRFLLQNCYPSLRHTDYRIAYTIRGYSDVDEIERIMHTRPQNLSLNEFNLVAQEYEPGSDKFTEVYETAVRMYPTDETANLNAANAAMRRGDNALAERYLAKAGNSPEAVYARGALAIRNEDYDTARRYLERAKRMGVAQAKTTLEQLAQGKRINNK